MPRKKSDTSGRLTVRQVADRLAISIDSTYRLIDQDELHAIDVSVTGRRRQYRITEAEVERFELRRSVA